MSLISHAETELDFIGMKDEEGMNGMMRKHILHMIEEFSKEGHSGFSASYAASCLEKLMRYEPLAPLTGEDWEWVDVGEQSGGPLWQNKRCSKIFKDKDGAYDIDAIVWYEWVTDKETGEKYKTHFTNYESRVRVEFPYTPKTEYREWVETD